AALSDFQLRDYKTWNGQQVNLVGSDHRAGDINLKFVASDGKNIGTNDLPFTLDAKPLELGAGDSVSFSAICKIDSSRSIEKIFHVTGKGYVIGIEYRLHGLENTVSGYHYTASIDQPLPFVERRSADELSNAKAFAGVGGELEDFTTT